MGWYEFVFSQKPTKRLLRHLVFWMAWWLYFSICYYLYQQEPPSGSRPFYVTVGSHLIIKTFLLTLIAAVACYTFIYLILPVIQKGKWLKTSAKIFLLCAFLFVAAYFMYWAIFPFVDSLFGTYKLNRSPTRFWPAISLGILDPLKVVAAAGIIKYVKYWWLKQEENEHLERGKINAELQLLKAQIHPGFLFTALNNIYVYSLAASPRASEMLLKLSDLLSYMLYECDQPLVLLEKEVEMMKDYIAFEKIRQNIGIETELNVRGDMTGKMIAPFLLLPFIENSFKQSSQLTEHPWINIDISVQGETFFMKLANGTKSSTSIQAFSENGLTNVKKRLALIYPQKHDLKINSDLEMLIVVLKIQLSETAVTETAEDVKPVTIQPAIT